MDTLTNQKIQDRLAGYDEDVQAFLQLAQIRRRNPFSESHEAEASQSYREIAWKGYRHRSFLEFDPHGMDPALRASWSYQPWILSGHPCREPSQQSWDIVDCARGLNILPGSKSREPDELLKSQAELARLYLEAHGSELQGLLSRGIRSQRLEWSLSAKPCLRADTRLLLSLKAMGWIAAGMALALPVRAPAENKVPSQVDWE
jgi:hypothetical protein